MEDLYGLLAEEGAVGWEGLAGEEGTIGGGEREEERTCGECREESCRGGSLPAEGGEVARRGEAFDEVACKAALCREGADSKCPLREGRVDKAHQSEVHFMAR